MSSQVRSNCKRAYYKEILYDEVDTTFGEDRKYHPIHGVRGVRAHHQFAKQVRPWGGNWASSPGYRFKYINSTKKKGGGYGE